MTEPRHIVSASLSGFPALHLLGALLFAGSSWNPPRILLLLSFPDPSYRSYRGYHKRPALPLLFWSPHSAMASSYHHQRTPLPLVHCTAQATLRMGRCIRNKSCTVPAPLPACGSPWRWAKRNSTPMAKTWHCCGWRCWIAAAFECRLRATMSHLR